MKTQKFKEIKFRMSELCWSDVECEMKISKKDYKKLQKGKVTVDELIYDYGFDYISRHFHDPLEIEYEFNESEVQNNG